MKCAVSHRDPIVPLLAHLSPPYYGDSDRAANGVIVHPSGLATASSSEVQTSEGTASAGDGGGCFIATAAFGSYIEPHVKLL